MLFLCKNQFLHTQHKDFSIFKGVLTLQLHKFSIPRGVPV